jgi:response regulator RpfG family c-di-GMP phosphodiesterase
VKVVVVGESGFTRSSINVNLRSDGYSVTEVDPICLFDVLAVMREVEPHLVVVDHDMPSCNCETLIRIIREDPVLATTPVLLIVPCPGSEETERILNWDRVRIMEKPLQVEALLQEVQHHFTGFTSHQACFR